MFSVDGYAYITTFWQLLRTFSAARSLKSAAVHRRMRDHATGAQNDRKPSRRLSADGIKRSIIESFNNRTITRASTGDVSDSRLPWWAAVAHAIVSLGLIEVVLFTQCGTDRYPFGDWDHPCRPCVCDSDGVLESCNVPAELKTSNLNLIN